MKCILLALLSLVTTARAEVLLADGGKTRQSIVVDPAATATEVFAARELAAHLHQITGADFNILTNAKAPARAILVGTGAAARKVFSEVPLDTLGPEEIVLRTKGNRLLLAGGRPRGTLYAVSRFLQDQCAVRWWTPLGQPHPETTNATAEFA